MTHPNDLKRPAGKGRGRGGSLVDKTVRSEHEQNEKRTDLLKRAGEHGDAGTSESAP